MQQGDQVVQEIDQDFSEPWEQSDVVLLVEGQKFHVHRLILSMCSPVFSRMFSADFKEKGQDEIPLPEKKAAEIREMLLVIYPSSCKQVDEINLHFLLPLAREYQMKTLKKKCEDYLLRGIEKKQRIGPMLPRKSEKCEIVSMSRMLQTLIVAQNFSLERVTTECINQAQNLSIEKLRSHDLYEQIEPLTQRRIIEFHMSKMEKELKDAKAKILELKNLAGEVKRNFESIVSHLGSHIRHAKNIHNLNFKVTTEQNMRAIANDNLYASSFETKPTQEKGRDCAYMSDIYQYLQALQYNLTQMQR